MANRVIPNSQHSSLLEYDRSPAYCSHWLYHLQYQTGQAIDRLFVRAMEQYSIYQSRSMISDPEPVVEHRRRKQPQGWKAKDWHFFPIHKPSDQQFSRSREWIWVKQKPRLPDHY